MRADLKPVSLLPTSGVLKLCPEEGLLKLRLMGPTPSLCFSGPGGWGLRMCMSSDQPSDAKAMSQITTF